MWLETIVLRVSGEQKVFLEGELFNHLLPRALRVERLDGLKIFQRSDMDTDLAITLLWGADGCTPSGSQFGKHLAASLTTFCPISHKTWQEISRQYEVVSSPSEQHPRVSEE